MLVALDVGKALTKDVKKYVTQVVWNQSKPFPKTFIFHSL